MTLENLLNNLIQRGRVPFGEGYHRSPYKRVRIYKNQDTERTNVLFYSDNHTHWKVLRQVVSKESGLWQFVCENEMIDEDKCWISDYRRHDRRKDNNDNYINYNTADYRYRLIESALKDESELEGFLLVNIKV